MNSRKRVIALAGAVLLGLAGVVHAEATASDADLKNEIGALKARIAQLENKQADSWMTERRAEEVKALVREVLADADTRSSLLATGLTAGHNGQNFFLSSEDGSFLLNISGLIQARYTYSYRHVPGTPIPNGDGTFSPPPPDSDNSEGFEIPRAEINFAGHIGTPRVSYAVRLQADPNLESLFVPQAQVGYDLTDTLTISGGRFKGQFLREDIIDDGYSLAVDRSVVSAAFGIGYVEGVQATWAAIPDALKVNLGLTDGIRSGNPSGIAGEGQAFNNDRTQFAVTGRADYKIMGDWKQYGEYSSWSEEETAAFVGAAIEYDFADPTNQFAKTGGGVDPVTEVVHTGVHHVLLGTVDGSFKTGGFTLYAAGVAAFSKGDAIVTGGADRTNNYAIMVQGGYMVIPNKLEPFARYEWIRADESIRTSFGHSEVSVITAGVNYYIHKHAAKLTADVVWVLDPIDPGNSLFATGGGNGVNDVLAADSRGQVLIRAQFQVMF